MVRDWREVCWRKAEHLRTQYQGPVSVGEGNREGRERLREGEKERKGNKEKNAARDERGRKTSVGGREGGSMNVRGGKERLGEERWKMMSGMRERGKNGGCCQAKPEM